MYLVWFALRFSFEGLGYWQLVLSHPDILTHVQSQARRARGHGLFGVHHQRYHHVKIALQITGHR